MNVWISFSTSPLNYSSLLLRLDINRYLFPTFAIMNKAQWRVVCARADQNAGWLRTCSLGPGDARCDVKCLHADLKLSASTTKKAFCNFSDFLPHWVLLASTIDEEGLRGWGTVSRSDAVRRSAQVIESNVVEIPDQKTVEDYIAHIWHYEYTENCYQVCSPCVTRCRLLARTARSSCTTLRQRSSG